MQDYKNLVVWERSHDYVMDIYDASESFPVEERYGLTTQIRRAAVSVPCNIAEGCGRDTDADFKRILHIAMGSANEAQYLTFLCHARKLIPKAVYPRLDGKVVEAKKMLSSMILRLRAES